MSRFDCIVGSALEGESISEGDLRFLFSIEPDSPEFEAMRRAREAIAKKTTRGTLIAQIGVDSQPCPGNCFHCSFAHRFNKRSSDRWFLSDDQVVGYARDFASRGANVIDLMVTAAFDFEHLLELICQVREAVGSDMPIMMNMGDFGITQAERMKAAGVTSIFHAVRMGEGLVTDIPLERRFETYAAANAVGFKIAASCENVSPQFTDAAIARILTRLRDEVRPQTCSCTSKRLVEGTAGCAQPDFPPEKLAVYQTAYALSLSGTCARFGGQYYAEAGTNPRDWSLQTEVDGLIKKRGSSIEGFAEQLSAAGYEMEVGPSRYW